MTRRLLSLLAALTIGTVLVSTLPSSSDPWGDRADQAIARFRDEDSGSENAHAYAYMAGALARRTDWQHADVARYLERVASLANPDGGYGLNNPYDAFQDGTTNPARTTYTVSVTDHVGRVLLNGWQAGVVTQERIGTLVDLIMEMPRVPAHPGNPGICIAYSNHSNDTEFCVPNVNAGAGWFLSRAAELGITRPGLAALLDGIRQRDASSFNEQTGWWPYIEGRSTPNDMNHNAYNAESELLLNPAIAQRAIDAVMGRDRYERWTDPLGQIRLVPFACNRASDSLGLFDRLLQDDRQSPRLLAQMAYWAARNAVEC